jgi:flagellar biosynthesis protein FlhG
MEGRIVVNDQASILRQSFKAPNGRVQEGRGGLPLGEAAAAGTSRPRACKSIAITSGKGGVGKSTMSISLAIALSSLKKKVCVVDADLGLANIHLLLGIAPKRNLSHIVNEECGLSEIISRGPGGIHIVPGASGIEGLANLDPLRLGLLQRKLMQLEQQYDFLIIDTGAGIGKTTTEFAAKADMGVVVVTPDPASLADAYAMVKVLLEKKISRLSVLLNMVGGADEGKETFDKLNTLVVKFLGRPLDMIGMVPADTQVSVLIKRQKMALIENPRSLFSIRIGNCARMLSGIRAMKKEGFFARLLFV